MTWWYIVLSYMNIELPEFARNYSFQSGPNVLISCNNCDGFREDTSLSSMRALPKRLTGDCCDRQLGIRCILPAKPASLMCFNPLLVMCWFGPIDRDCALFYKVIGSLWGWVESVRLEPLARHGYLNNVYMQIH